MDVEPQAAEVRHPVRRRVGPELAEVEAGAEGPAGAADQQHGDLVVFGRRDDLLVQAFRQRPGHGVPASGPVQHDLGDAVLPARDDRIVGRSHVSRPGSR